MRIALVASPFISVPPAGYGGTELFIAQLAEGLKKRGVEVVVYANGESRVATEVRWLYEKSQWPIEGEVYANLKDINHTAWAIRDAWDYADIIHLNNIPGLAFARFEGPEFAYTIHHKHEPALSHFYEFYPQVQYVSISNFQRRREKMPRNRTIHHGVDMSQYALHAGKREYLSFLGRIAPLKGTHTAIEVAKRSGIPLKIAGEVQPIYRDYFEAEIKPHLDGKFIEYVGEADLNGKNELLGNSLAMLFPIEWDEPFGLVMIESMATGTPVIAFAGGSVDEVVEEGVSGNVCRTADEMAALAKELPGRFNAEAIRAHAEERFSVERMVREYESLYMEMISNRDRMKAGGQFYPGVSLRMLPEPEEITDEVSALSDDPEEPRAIA